MRDSEAYRALIVAVSTLCLASADRGDAPDDWGLHEMLEPFVRAVVETEREREVTSRG